MKNNLTVTTDNILYDKAISIIDNGREKVVQSIYHETTKPKDIIKDPYILDFLGLDEITQINEKLLETKLIEHLEKFLLELVRGFAFVGKQYRLTLSEDNFYNIPLKC